jgi:2-polyprenyl-3-methyl-5-hydroxy-6-metoxy-1,4-benzoquinol methylase
VVDQANGFLSPWLRSKRIEMASPYLQGRILDYGCGVGELAKFCQPNAYVGVDIDKESINTASARYPDFTFKREISESEKFDTIVSLAVIEHVPDPGAFLKKFRMMLKPNGSIVITTPHPRFEEIHTLGAKLGLFSSEAHEEHDQLIDLTLMQQLANLAGAHITVYKRFLIGANQLFILKSTE